MDSFCANRLLMTAPDALAIDGDHLAFCHSTHALHPARKAVCEGFRFQQTKHSPKRIMRGYPMRQFEKTLQPLFLGFPVGLHLTPRVGSTNHPTNGNNNDVD